VSETRPQRVLATLEAPVCEYCGTRITTGDRACPALDEGVLRHMTRTHQLTLIGIQEAAAYNPSDPRDAYPGRNGGDER